MIRFTDGTVISASFVERDDVVHVSFPHSCRNVHDERRFAVEPERGGGEKGSLDTMRFLLTQHTARRHMGIALLLPIKCKRIEEILNLNRRGEAREFLIFL